MTIPAEAERSLGDLYRAVTRYRWTLLQGIADCHEHKAEQNSTASIDIDHTLIGRKRQHPLLSTSFFPRVKVAVKTPRP